MWQTLAQKGWHQSTDEWSSTIVHTLEVDDVTDLLRIRTATTQTHDFIGGPKPKTVETVKDVGSLIRPNLSLIRSLSAAPSKYYGGSPKWKGWNGTVGEATQIIAEWKEKNDNFGKETLSDDDKRKLIVDKVQTLRGPELEKIRRMLRMSSRDEKRLASIADRVALFGINAPGGPKPKFKRGDKVETYGGYSEIWSVGDYDDYVKDRRYVVMNPETHHKLNMFEKNIKKASVADRVSQNVIASWERKADNVPRPPRMKKPIPTPGAHRVYTLYIQDLLSDILKDKYGDKRGEENFEYFVNKGGGAFFAVGQQIQDEKAQMYLDLGERPPHDYFAETYFDVWKRWMARPQG